MSTSALHRGVDHIAVHCYDLDATVQFYTEGLEFKFVREWSAPDVGVHRCIFLDAGDDRLIELFDAASAAPGGNPQGLDLDHRPADEDRARHATLVHFAIRTDDPEEIFQRALAAGARPFLEPTTVTTVGPSPFTMEVGFVYGLNGEVIEFIKRP